ncbi:MAG TPA: hypothetical protein VLH61_09300 [Bacteroidales bacterium]|nr:hypothetical protein [Bacteroidales bacterium]
MSDTLISIGLYVTYFLVVLAVVSTVVFGLMQIVRNFKKAKGALVGMAVLIVIIIISLALSTGEPYPAFNIGENASRWIGAGITSTFILAGLGLIAGIYTEISKMFK